MPPHRARRREARTGVSFVFIVIIPRLSRSGMAAEGPGGRRWRRSPDGRRASIDPRSSTTGSGLDASSSSNRRCIRRRTTSELRSPSCTHGKSAAVRKVRSYERERAIASTSGARPPRYCSCHTAVASTSVSQNRIRFAPARPRPRAAAGCRDVDELVGRPGLAAASLGTLYSRPYSAPRPCRRRQQGAPPSWSCPWTPRPAGRPASRTRPARRARDSPVRVRIGADRDTDTGTVRRSGPPARAGHRAAPPSSRRTPAPRSAGHPPVAPDDLADRRRPEVVDGRVLVINGMVRHA